MARLARRAWAAKAKGSRAWCCDPFTAQRLPDLCLNGDGDEPLTASAISAGGAFSD